MKRWCALVAVLFAVMASASAQEKPADPDRWEPAIQKFEAEDKANPPVRDGIVFIGASSIVRWNLAESFPDLKAVNRGFGGSEMADSARYAARVVLPHAPRIVVLYPGENDLARGTAQMHETNTLIRSYCASHTRCVYMDVWPAMLGADGKPRPEHFIADGQHMTPDGYKVWTQLVRPHLN